jgi:AcrR family transcriptional regulator
MSFMPKEARVAGAAAGRTTADRARAPRRRLAASERRRALLAALESAVIDRGWQGATVPEVVARAGVAQGTFYRYYENLDEAFRALVVDLIEPIRRSAYGFDPAAARTVADLEQFIYATHGSLTETITAHPVLLREALLVGSAAPGAAGDAIRAFLAEMRGLLRRQLAQVNGRPPFRVMDPAIAAGAAMGMLLAAVQEAAERPQDFDGETWRREIARLESGMLTASVDAARPREGSRNGL